MTSVNKPTDERAVSIKQFSNSFSHLQVICQGRGNSRKREISTVTVELQLML